MKRCALQILALLLSAGAIASDLNVQPVDHIPDLSEKTWIRTETGGLLPVHFEIILRYLNQPDFIQRMQADYRRSIYPENTAAFPIRAGGPRAYTHVDRKQHRTDILELYRGQTSASTYDLTYHAGGHRGFGKFDALIHVHLVNAGPAGTAYTATLHAYPHNGPLRYLARRTGTIDQYFKRKTRSIVRASHIMCADMGFLTPLNYPSMLQAMDAAQ